MPFVTGGMLQEWGSPKGALLTVQREIVNFNGRTTDDEYCVDLAMLTWHSFREPERPLGVTPGPVGRTQRRFIVWLSVPLGLESPKQVREWLVEVLPETERLVREYLPQKSKAYPADELGDEVVVLRPPLDQPNRQPHYRCEESPCLTQVSLIPPSRISTPLASTPGSLLSRRPGEGWGHRQEPPSHGGGASD